MRTCVAFTLATVFLLPIVAPTGASAVDTAKVATGQMAALDDPREAGIRYGQALGMAAVCVNMQPTAKAEALARAFSGQDLETFRKQADAVLLSWKKLLQCGHTKDPNPCRLSHQMSCREAFKEIGTYGAVAPGLVELGSKP